MAELNTTEKNEPVHDEITYHRTTEPVQLAHGAIDKETAEYAGAVATPVDAATNRRLFWTINKRILLCMLGVRVGYHTERLDSC